MCWGPHFCLLLMAHFHFFRWLFFISTRSTRGKKCKLFPSVPCRVHFPRVRIIQKEIVIIGVGRAMWSQCRCVVYVLAQHSHKFFNERLAALPVARIPTHSRNTAGAIGRRERIFAGISPARATVAHRPEEMHRDQDSLTHRYYRCHGWEFIAILPEKLIISKVFERVAWFDFQRLRLLDGTGNNVTCTSSPVIGKSCDHTRTRGSWWSFQLFFLLSLEGKGLLSVWNLKFTVVSVGSDRHFDPCPDWLITDVTKTPPTLCRAHIHLCLYLEQVRLRPNVPPGMMVAVAVF